MSDTFDNELSDFLRDEENECLECGRPTELDYCSNQCIKASML